jgi:hypothetical protein
MNFEQGDKIEFDINGVTREGVIVLASPNNVSLMIGFRGIIDDHLGMMPVLRDDQDNYHILTSNKPIEIRKLS